MAGRIEPAMPIRPTPSAPPPGLTAAPDVMSLLLALRRRWIAAVLLGGTLAVITSISVWFLLAPRATAFVQLQVAYSEKHILASNQGSPGDFKPYLTTAAQQLTSIRVISNALKREEVKRLGLDAKEVDAARAIQEDLRTEFKESSEILTLLYSHIDPQVATAVVNGIKEAFLEDVVYSERAKRVANVTKLEKAVGETADGLKTKKDSLKKIGQTLGTVDPLVWREERLAVTTALRDSKQQHAAIGFKIIEAQAALETHEARAKVLASRAATPTKATPAATVSDREAYDAAFEEALERDHERNQLRSSLGQVEEVVAELERKGYPSYYFTVKEARKRQTTIREQLSQREKQIAGRVKKTLAARAATPPPTAPTGPLLEDPAIMRAQLQRQVEDLKKLDEKMRTDIDALAKQAAKTPVLASEYEQLADDIRGEEKLLESMRMTLERERVELLAAQRINSFQNGELMKPDNKKQILAAGVSPLAVFGAVSLGLAWLEFRKRRVRSAGEISRGLGIRVVGAVPRMPHLERHLVGQTGECELEGTPVMESIDAIRTRLLHEANTKSTRVVLVTSAGPGEGKTTLASALATSLARAGRRTLLLDGDLRRPTVHELFEVAMQPGFSEVLLGEIEVAEAAQETPQENLSVIPAGQWDREVLLALARDGLEGVFERLSEEFDFVIVDSHPVLAATDALLLGRQADAVLLSVLREVSQMPRVYAASQQLTAVGIRVLGAVVNGTCPEEVYTTSNVPVAVG